MKKNAFTMIELVFVIVVLGILAAVAIPRLAVTRTDAQITKARADISSIRSSIINERQTRLFRGQSAFISTLDSGGALIFDGNGTSTLLQYGITPSAANGHWSKTAANTYQFTVGGGIGNAVFFYTQATGRFDCAGVAGNTGTACAKLTN